MFESEELVDLAWDAGGWFVLGAFNFHGFAQLGHIALVIITQQNAQTGVALVGFGIPLPGTDEFGYGVGVAFELEVTAANPEVGFGGGPGSRKFFQQRLEGGDHAFRVFALAADQGALLVSEFCHG